MLNMKKIHFYCFGFLILSLGSCDQSKEDFDASGTFEAVETIISAEVSGKILRLDIEEGQEVKAGQVLGYIDSAQLHLQRLQLEQNKKAILSGKPHPKIQTGALREQLVTARNERERMANLVVGGVATQKQLDDAEAHIATLEAQISAQESTLNTGNLSIDEQARLVEIQLQEVKDRLERSLITNPVNGTVLSKYAEPHEMTGFGRPIYKVADLSTMTLRAYITGDQLSQVKLNQAVQVFTDGADGKYRETGGTVTWINDKAEFTPKSIHTKNERANLVYAIKVSVPNDGSYKIGMYGELKFQ